MKRLLLALAFIGSLASQAQAAITVVQSNGQSNVSSSATCALAGVVAGNAVIAMGMSFNLTFSVADSNGTPVQDVAQFAGTSSYGIGIWSVLNAASGTHTLTISGGSTNSALHCYEVSGLATSSALDKTAHGTGTGTAMSSGATSATTAANEIVFGFGHTNDLITRGASFTGGVDTSEGSFAQRASSEFKIVSATGAQTADMTSGSATQWEVDIATYKASSGAVAVPCQRSLLGVGCE